MFDPEGEKDFLERTQNIWSTKEKTEKLGLSKLTSFAHQKRLLRKLNGKPQPAKKIFTTYMSVKGLASRIYK